MQKGWNGTVYQYDPALDTAAIAPTGNRGAGLGKAPVGEGEVPFQSHATEHVNVIEDARWPQYLVPLTKHLAKQAVAFAQERNVPESSLDVFGQQAHAATLEVLRTVQETLGDVEDMPDLLNDQTLSTAVQFWRRLVLETPVCTTHT